MATFYILPARELVGERFAQCLEALFPGLSWEESCWTDLAEALSAAASTEEIYVLFRDEIPENRELMPVLRSEFGAEDNDRVVEVGLPNLPSAGAPMGLRAA